MEPLYVAGVITASTGAAAGLAWFARGFARLVRNVGDLADDWRGEPGRAGVPGRPGVMARLAALEHGQSELRTDVGAITKELHPNGGSSLRDAVNRVEHGMKVSLESQHQPVQVNVGVPPPPTS